MLPNLIVIGAAKCGTTSLHYYLNLHPQISMSKEKELDFFVGERNWSKGLVWYESQFTGDAKIHGESSPKYTFYPFYAGVPERMCAVVPEAKLIYVLRDPLERIISQYFHNYASGQEDRSFAQALTNLKHNPYVCRSRYYMQLEQYLPYFLQSNILLITQEDLSRQRRQTLQKVFRFLNVDDSFYYRKFSNIRHKSRDKRRKNRIGLLLTRMPGMNVIKRLPPDVQWHVERLIYFPFSHKIERPKLDERLRQELIDNLKDDISRLREYTGNDFEGWCL